MKYKIKKGDTLSKISRNLGVSVKDLAKLNNITDINKIQAGKSLNISMPKKASSIERVVPEKKKTSFVPTGKNPYPTAPAKAKKNSKDKFLPINVRQFFNPNEDRTEKDLSKAEKIALKKVVEYSQSEERRADKVNRGVSPNLIEYSDYNAMEGVSAGDASQSDAKGKLRDKIKNPFYI